VTFSWTLTFTSGKRFRQKLTVTALKFVPTPVSVMLYRVAKGLAAEYMEP
jgi:hypothetical protein